jgi:FAD/FMN-containing dehydrogenase
LNAEELQQLLQDKLGADCVLTAASDVAAWTSDWRGMYQGQAAAVVRPRTTQGVADCVALCASLGVPVVPRGGNTGLCGGATPDDNPLNVVLSLDRMNAITSVDPVANTMVVQAGCILGDLQRAAEAHGRLFPLSLAAEDSCQIGGNLATNAGGVNVVRYGMVRDLVLGLEVQHRLRPEAAVPRFRRHARHHHCGRAAHLPCDPHARGRAGRRRDAAASTGPVLGGVRALRGTHRRL